MSESPLTVGELTPRPLLINETPPTSQLGRTPLSESDVTPAPLVTHGGALGSVTPVLPQGNFTPAGLPPGSATPVLPQGSFTPGMASMPMPGSETPPTGDVKNMPGGATPNLQGDTKSEVFGMKAKSDVGSETPAGVGGATPLPNIEKAEGTPADWAKREGAQTPFDAGAGDVTPGGEGAR